MELNELIKDLQETRVSHSRPRFRVWEPFMRKYNIQSICEVGVRDGMNFKQLIAHQPSLAVAVDCWKDDGVLPHNDGDYTQNELDVQYETFKSEMADKPFVKIYREYSFEAVRRFEDNTFDFIYIDADHTYEGVLEDLIDWYPKVKSGGLFCGHDYVNKMAKTRMGHHVRFGVAQAVDEFTKINNLMVFTAPLGVWGVVKP